MLENPLLGKMNALAVLAAWACLALFIVALAYLKLTAAQDSGVRVLVVILGAFIALTITHVTLSFLVRCPHCNGRLTAQRFGRARYGDWSSAVVGWFSGSIVCIHCGSHVRTVGGEHDL